MAVSRAAAPSADQLPAASRRKRPKKYFWPSAGFWSVSAGFTVVPR